MALGVPILKYFRVVDERANFFPFRFDLVLEKLCCQGKQIGNHKSCSPL